MQQDSGAKDEFIITKGFDYYRLIGYRCFGPLVIGFLDWMRQETEQSKCEQIIFTARDCFVFNEAFKILYPNFNLPVKYLYLSRASTLPARIVEQPSVETFLNNATLKRYTSPNLLVTRYGFDEKQWHDRILSLGIEPDKPVDKNSYYVEGPYRKLAKMILEDYLPQAFTKTNLLCQYLEDQGVSGRVAVVDSGWNGSTQSAIISLAERLHGDTLTTVGLYLMANNPERQVREGMNIKGYLYDGNHSRNDYVFSMAAQGLVEFFCGQQCGSTIGYAKNVDGSIVPVLDKYEFASGSDYSEVADIMNVMHEGCLCYVKENVGRPFLSVEHSFCQLKKITSEPCFEDVKRLGSLLFLEGEVHPLAKPEPLKTYVSNPKKLIADFSRSTWKLGFLNSLFHNKAFSLFLYRILLRFK